MLWILKKCDVFSSKYFYYLILDLLAIGSRCNIVMHVRSLLHCWTTILACTSQTGEYMWMEYNILKGKTTIDQDWCELGSLVTITYSIWKCLIAPFTLMQCKTQYLLYDRERDIKGGCLPHPKENSINWPRYKHESSDWVLWLVATRHTLQCETTTCVLHLSIYILYWCAWATKLG